MKGETKQMSILEQVYEKMNNLMKIEKDFERLKELSSELGRVESELATKYFGLVSDYRKFELQFRKFMIVNEQMQIRDSQPRDILLWLKKNWFNPTAFDALEKVINQRKAFYTAVELVAS